MGIVGYELEEERTGVARVLAGLLAAAAADAPSTWRFLVFLRRPVEQPALEGERVQTVFPERSPRFARPVLWEQLELPALIRSTGVDVVFSPSYSLPPRTGAPGVVTVHDLSFERLPQEFTWRERWRRRILARRACRVASRVLVDARPIADEIHRCYRVPEDRLAVVAPAVEEAFAPAADASERSQDVALVRSLGVRPPFLLHVGSLLERRRPAALLAALREARALDPDVRLVLAGPNRLRRRDALEELVSREGARDSVVELGWIDERSLLALYRSADVTLSLSSYEGYCLPPLESLACGTPAVVDSAPGLVDLWPDYPFVVRAADGEQLARTMRDVLHARRNGAWSSADAIARIRSHGWHQAARRWMDELERAGA